MNNNNLDFKSYSPKISNCDSPKQKMSKLLSDFVVVDINNKINSKILYDNNITKNSIIEENIYENKFHLHLNSLHQNNGNRLKTSNYFL